MMPSLVELDRKTRLCSVPEDGGMILWFSADQAGISWKLENL